ncbi:hypothetical protein [Streptomyces hawaiiensis]|uniref:Terpene synthase n=1 Tax=Streptomyces hawaiiensis TaxID=67305 RepID=A0A6G5R6A5_9ACTN|nr:hypothetical protein [Streptomyces hawaiiensis]QCD53575.1 hypothetical protein CEB94_00520 [Streptomyces hawaiiensis]
MAEAVPGMKDADAAPGHDLQSHRQWMTAFWHASRMVGKVLPTASTDSLRYIAPKDHEFLEAFFGRYCREFPVTRHLNPKHVKDQTHLTVMSFPKVRDFSTLATLNHAMLVTFYVDDHRHRLDLVRLLDDSRADPVVHAFMKYIKSEIPNAYEGYTDAFREFLAGSLLQGKVKRSEILYSRVKSVTMGILPVHYVRWSLYGLPAHKFGTLKLHNYMHWLELDTVLVNDRYSLGKESDSSEWNAIAAHSLSHEELTAMIDDNYAHLVAALGELLVTEEDRTCVAAYEDFKICADATKTWEEFSPRYHTAHSGTDTEGPGSSQPATHRFSYGPTGLGTQGLRLGISSTSCRPVAD